jgi:hypothetical protein
MALWGIGSWGDEWVVVGESGGGCMVYELDDL